MAFDLITEMYKYQKRRGIVKKCIDNTQFALDCIKESYPGANVKATAILMTSFDPDEGHMRVCGGHLVILVDDNHILDPSYETSSAPNNRYFKTLSALLEAYPKVKNDKALLANTIKLFFDFSKFAERINNGDIMLTDRTYYNDQADFLERRAGLVN